MKKLICICMSVMMIALSGCQTSAKTGGFTSYDEHYQKNETTLKEDALSDRWESRGSKVAVVSKEKADNNDYPEAKEVLLVNNTKNKVIVSQKVFDQAYPASTTKIMTAYVALKYGNLDDIVTASERATDFAEDEQVCGLQAGDQLSLRDLLNGLLLYSGNDCAVAIAEHVSGSVEAFVDKMNEEARNLGATGTHFVNPHGLQNEDHYTTAYDLYLMFNACLQNPQFVEMISQTSYTANLTSASGVPYTMTWEPTNYYASGDAAAPEGVKVIGGKTGTTDEAGSCLVLYEQDQQGRPYISIVMGASQKSILYDNMTRLMSSGINGK